MQSNAICAIFAIWWLVDWIYRSGDVAREAAAEIEALRRPVRLLVVDAEKLDADVLAQYPFERSHTLPERGDRLFIGLTLMGAAAFVPQVPMAVLPEDAGRWMVVDGAVVDVRSAPEIGAGKDEL